MVESEIPSWLWFILKRKVIGSRILPNAVGHTSNRKSYVLADNAGTVTVDSKKLGRIVQTLRDRGLQVRIDDTDPKVCRIEVRDWTMLYTKHISRLEIVSPYIKQAETA